MKYLYSIVFILLMLSCERDHVDLTCQNSFENASKLNGLNIYSAQLNSTNNTNVLGNSISLVGILSTSKDYFNHSFEIKDYQIDESITNYKQGLENTLPNTLIMLRPLVDFGGIPYRGDFYLETEDHWQIFENSYKKLILKIAELSNTHPIDLLCIGTELREFVKRRPLFWESLIETLKEECPALKLIYAANWDDYEAFPFWEEMDYIGIDSYFPLVNKPTPTVEELIAAYSPIKNNIRNFSCQHDKKIVFTEYGFRSIDYAAWKSWELPGTAVATTYNFAVQSNGYEAFYKSFWDEPWVAGGFLWIWNLFKTELSTNPMLLNHWDPNFKPAESVIAHYYTE